MKGITERQASVLHLLITMSRDRGFPPTVRELADRLGITNKAVHDHLRALQSKGFIEIEAKISRGIRVLMRGSE